MSLHPQPVGEVPAETARASRAASPKTTLVTRLRDALDTMLELFKVRGLVRACGEQRNDSTHVLGPPRYRMGLPCRLTADLF